jgi:DNA primase
VGIADDDVAAVRAASDIVGIISQYTQLRRVGRRWVGLCPFHSERTGSFSVNAEEGLWYCFGCQARGDAITFVREVEHLDFVGAVEWLAARAGITLRYTNRNEAEGRKRRARLVDVVTKAVEWYHQRLLTAGDAGPARRYLRSRGLDGDVVREYRLGWAPDGWDELCRALQLSENVARETGLGFRNNRNRLQDTFRSRVVFPIFDPQGDPVGFGGRILPEAGGSANQPKYKNTPETPIYHKSKVLYGLDRAKAAMVSSDTAVICEGYTDVIGFHRCGVPTAVATCGTALTDDHVELLRRYARRLVLAFDADRAGQSAAERFYRWERDHELEVAVADLSPGMDPADLAQHDPERLLAAVENAAPFLRFRLDRVFSSGDLTTPERRARTAEAALAMVAEHPVDLVRDQYLMDVAGRCRIDPERLRPRLEALRREGSGRRRDPHPRRTDPAGPVSSGDAGTDVPGPGPQQRQDWGARGGRARASQGGAGDVRRGPDEGPAIEVLRHAIHNADAIAPWLWEQAFTDPLHRQALQALAKAQADGIKPSDALAASESPDLADLLTRLIVDEPRSDPFDAVRRLLTEAARRELANLRLSAASMDEPGEAEALAESAFLSRCIDDLRSDDDAMGAADRLIAWLRRRVGDEG